MKVIPCAFNSGDLQNIINALIPSIRVCSWLSFAVESMLQESNKQPLFQAIKVITNPTKFAHTYLTSWSISIINNTIDHFTVACLVAWP